MLAGVFWHAALFLHGVERGWGSRSPVVIGVADALLFGLHAFRMPLFFLLAGFFGALLLARLGARGFTQARLTRIGLPLAVALVTVVPASQVLLALMTGQTPAVVPKGFGVAWFLWYLLVLYAVSLLVARLAGDRIGAIARSALGWLLSSPLRVPLLGALVTALMWRISFPDPGTAAWTQPPFALAYFGCFFWAGWLLWSRQDLLPAMCRNPGAHVIGAVLLCGVLVVLTRRALVDPDWHIPRAAGSALLAWCAIFASFGIARVVFARPRAWVRYLSDAAYWIYLAHVPLVIALAWLSRHWEVPVLLAVPLAGGIAFVVLLAVYEKAVRYTAIGAVLHGPRSRPGRMDEFQRSRGGGEVPILGQ